MVIIPGTMLYAAELTWKGMEGEYQAAVNRMGCVATGAFRTNSGRRERADLSESTPRPSTGKARITTPG